MFFFMQVKVCFNFLVDATFAADQVSLKFEEGSEIKASFSVNNFFKLFTSFTLKSHLPFPANPPSLTASDSILTY